MKRDTFKSKLMALKKWIPTNSSVPVLKTVLIEYKGDKIRLSGTDLEIGVRVDIDYDGSEFEPFAVNIKKLYKTVKRLDADSVRFENDGDNPIIHFSDGTEYEPVIEDPDDFPEFPEIREDQGFSVPSEELRKWENKLVPAIAGEMKVNSLTGLYVNLNDEDDTLEAVGSDGNRLHRYTYNGHSKVSFDGNDACNIPERFITNLDYLINTKSDYEGYIGFWFNEDKVKVETENGITAFARQIEGNYPEYKKVIPDVKDADFEAEITETRDLKKTFRMLRDFGEDQPVSRVCVNGEAYAECKNNESGSLSKPLPIDDKHGEFDRFINPRYLEELFKAFKRKDESLWLRATDDKEEAVLLDDRERFDAVLMTLNYESVKEDWE